MISLLEDRQVVSMRGKLCTAAKSSVASTSRRYEEKISAIAFL